MARTRVQSRYAFGDAARQSAERFRVLESCYDPASRAGLAGTGVGPGWCCLEVGAGGGSIARWLCDTVGPTGSVVATDIDPGRIDPALSGRANLSVLRHDVVRDRLPGDRFDLIHARLVLLHLPRRRDVLARLATALAPGGWLVLDEFDCEWTPVLAADEPGRAELFGALRAAGLEQVSATTFAEAWPGGCTGIGLHRANTDQLRGGLLASGLSEQELSDFGALPDDPAFAVQSYSMTTARGRRRREGRAAC